MKPADLVIIMIAANDVQPTAPLLRCCSMLPSLLQDTVDYRFDCCFSHFTANTPHKGGR